MPTPNEDESRDDFISRCIPYVLDESGNDIKGRSQAAAYCHSIWEEEKVNKQAGFYLLHQRFDKPVQMRFGEVDEIWYLVIDSSEDQIIYRLRDNPVESESSIAYIINIATSLTQYDEDEVEVEPDTELNPTSDTRSWIELIDQGSIEVVDADDEKKTFRLDGDKINTKVRFKLEDTSQNLWLMEKSVVDIQSEHEFIEKNEERQIVGGIVYAPNELDKEGDWTTAEEIEKAMYQFMLERQSFDVLHNESDQDVKVVECFQPETEIEKNGATIPAGAWYMAVKVEDPSLWSEIKNGFYTGFSMAGGAKGKYEPLQ